MNNIINLIKVYLNEKESDYAVLIDGGWGCGKTYFVKNELMPLLGKKLNTERQFIYISLFGLKSMEDLYSAISLSVIEIKADDLARKRAEQQGYNVSKKINIANITGFKNILKKGLHWFPGGKELEYIANDIAKNTISFNKYIFVFDDFERASISKIELLGFFDMLADQNNAKTIVICNESKIYKSQLATNKTDNEDQSEIVGEECGIENTIIDDDDIYYQKYKEKIFGLQVLFRGDLSKSYDDLVDKYTSDSLSRDYLKKYKDVVLQRFETVGLSNLRTLIFIIKRFKEISEAVAEVFNKQDEGKKYLEMFIPRVLDNVIISSIEYKVYGKKNQYGSEEIEMFKRWGNNGLENIMYNMGDNIIYLYKWIDYYLYYYSIDSNIIMEQYNRLVEYESSIGSVVNKISEIYYKNEITAASGLKEIIDAICANKYNINIYPRILDDIYRLDKILFSNVDIELLEKRILSNAEKRVNEFDRFSWSTFAYENENARKFKEKLYSFLIDKQEKENNLFINKLLATGIDFPKKLAEFLERSSSTVNDNKSIFKNVHAEQFVDVLLRLNSKDISAVRTSLRSKYINIINIKDFYAGDYEFFCAANSCLKEKLADIDETKDKLELLHLKYLKKDLENIIDVLK